MDDSFHRSCLSVAFHSVCCVWITLPFEIQIEFAALSIRNLPKNRSTQIFSRNTLKLLFKFWLSILHDLSLLGGLFVRVLSWLRFVLNSATTATFRLCSQLVVAFFAVSGSILMLRKWKLLSTERKEDVSWVRPVCRRGDAYGRFVHSILCFVFTKIAISFTINQSRNWHHRHTHRFCSIVVHPLPSILDSECSKTFVSYEVVTLLRIFD